MDRVGRGVLVAPTHPFVFRHRHAYDPGYRANHAFSAHVEHCKSCPISTWRVEVFAKSKVENPPYHPPSLPPAHHPTHPPTTPPTLPPTHPSSHPPTQYPTLPSTLPVTENALTDISVGYRGGGERVRGGDALPEGALPRRAVSLHPSFATRQRANYTFVASPRANYGENERDSCWAVK